MLTVCLSKQSKTPFVFPFSEQTVLYKAVTLPLLSTSRISKALRRRKEGRGVTLP